MVILPVLAGGATLLATILLYDAWLHALPRSVCPRCGQATLAVSSPATGLLDRWVRQRWCGGCQWSGWGRNGPVHWTERGPVADGSGFRWGDERLGADLGFHWATERIAVSAANHPSGFRWRSNAARHRSRRALGAGRR
jgi:hypothetical protein